MHTKCATMGGREGLMVTTKSLSFNSPEGEQLWLILSNMRSEALYLLRSDASLDPERGVAYVKLLAGFAVLGFDLEGEKLDDYKG